MSICIVVIRTSFFPVLFPSHSFIVAVVVYMCNFFFLFRMCCWFDCENTFSTRNGINETGPCLAVYSIHHIRVCYMYACMAWYRVWLSNPQTNYYVTQQSEHDNSYSTPTLWALHYHAKFSYCFMLIRPLFLCINR